MHRDHFFFYSLYFSRYQELHNVILILYFVHMDVLIYYLVAALFFFISSDRLHITFFF